MGLRKPSSGISCRECSQGRAVYGCKDVQQRRWLFAAASMGSPGILLAAICQEPDYQGAKPMRLLFNYLALNTPPSREYYYTRNEIIINESL